MVQYVDVVAIILMCPYSTHNEIPTSRSLTFGIRSTQWHNKDKKFEGRICWAKYSCDGELVYAAFYDGSIGVFDATARLQLCCRIAPSAYYSLNQQWSWYIYQYPNPCGSHTQFFLLCQAAVGHELRVIIRVGVDLNSCSSWSSS